MLNEWIGRQERSEDEVALGTMRRVAALLDSTRPLKRGDCMPEGWYVALFTPTAPQSALGPDGHPAKGLFLPPVPLPRRMFAGRRVSFHEPLRIGEDATRASTIQSITPKQGRSGEMCFVTVRHEISGPRGLAVVEEQDIVYRGEAKSGSRDEPVRENPKPQWSRTLTPDPVMIFRYSAITFNAHRIHYDTAYTRDTEGYPDLIVNGGLATLLLWELAVESTRKRIRSSVSRNLRPLFVNRTLTLCGTPELLWALDSDGRAALEAKVELA